MGRLWRSESMILMSILPNTWSAAHRALAYWLLCSLYPWRLKKVVGGQKYLLYFSRRALIHEIRSSHPCSAELVKILILHDASIDYSNGAALKYAISERLAMDILQHGGARQRRFKHSGRPATESSCTRTRCWLRTFCLVTGEPRDSTNCHHLDRLINIFTN